MNHLVKLLKYYNIIHDIVILRRHFSNLNEIVSLKLGELDNIKIKKKIEIVLENNF